MMVDEIFGGDGSTRPIMQLMEQQLLPTEVSNFGFCTLSYRQEEVKGFTEIEDFPLYSPTGQLSMGSRPQMPLMTIKTIQATSTMHTTTLTL